MCIIVHKPEGKLLKEEYWRNAFDNNEDGAGMAYVDNGHLVIEKGFMKVEEFLKRIAELGSREMIVHTRRASAGMPINEDQCHPFWVTSSFYHEYPVLDAEGKPVLIEKGKEAGKPLMAPQYEMAVMHNGKLSFPHEKDESDTVAYIREVLGPNLRINPKWIDFECAHILLRYHIGFENRIAVMRYDVVNKKLKVNIINQDRKPGHWAHECWFSNYSYDYKRHDVEDDHKKRSIDMILERRWRDDGPPYTGTPWVYKSAPTGGHYDYKLGRWVYPSEGGTIAPTHLPAPPGQSPGPAWWDKAVKQGKKKPSSVLIKDGHDNCNDPKSLPDQTPDKYGWYWSGSRRMFVNINTDTVADYLLYRTRPAWADLPKAGSIITLDGKLVEQCGLIVNATGEIIGKCKGGTTIEDQDVELTDAQIEAAMDWEVKLKHLGKWDKRCLKEVAARYYRMAMGHEKSRSKDSEEHIKVLREDIRIYVDAHEESSSVEIDKWVIARTELKEDVADYLNGLVAVDVSRPTSKDTPIPPVVEAEFKKEVEQEMREALSQTEAGPDFPPDDDLRGMYGTAE